MPDTPVEQRRDDPYHPGLEPRVSRLEDDVHEIKATMRNLEQIVVRIEATLPHLATKADLAELRADLAEKPGKTYMWGVMTALLTAYACGLAALAVLK
jgi:hypothetical protein